MPAATRSRAPGWASSGSRSSRTSRTPGTRRRRTSSPACAAAEPTVRFHDPHVETFVDADGTTSDGDTLDTLLAESDVVVAFVNHRAIDWDGVFDRAPLIVDTIDAARGRVVRADQVLLLGAGWVPAGQSPA